MHSFSDKGNYGVLTQSDPNCPIAHASIISRVSKLKDKLTREIIKASAIGQLGSDCVRTPSFALSKKECMYLLRSESKALADDSRNTYRPSLVFFLLLVFGFRCQVQ